MKPIFLQQLKDSWFIVVPIVAIITTWTMFNARLTQAQQDIDDLKTVIFQINEIKTNIEVIKEKISNIEEKI